MFAFFTLNKSKDISSGKPCIINFQESYWFWRSKSECVYVKCGKENCSVNSCTCQVLDLNGIFKSGEDAISCYCYSVWQIVILSGKSSKGNIDFASKIIFRDFSTKISSSLFVPTFSFEASYILPACKGISEFIITHTNLEEE